MNSYDTFEEAKAYLEEKGFCQYDEPLFKDRTAGTFQKKYTDEIGKRYFLNATVFDFSKFHIPENFTVEYSTQLYQKKTRRAFDVTFIDWELEDAEKQIDKMFELEIIEHYERWD